MRSGRSRLFSFFTRLEVKVTCLDEIFVLALSENTQNSVNIIDGFDDFTAIFSELIPADVRVVAY